MAAFAPVYRQSASHKSLWVREQQRERKRKRDVNDDGDGAPSSPEQSTGLDPGDSPRVPYPVNRTDPYYVAGQSREQPLPGGNFPHASIKTFTKPGPSLEDELGRLNPPLYPHGSLPGGHPGSFKQRHLDNLTAILHRCMLSGDWQRAFRTWALLIRIEIDGHGIDIRRHGRWMIGAELLMRQRQSTRSRHVSRSNKEGGTRAQYNETEASDLEPFITETGFTLAREYYERLVLQYPYLQRTHHKSVNSLVIYPAMFNVWIYGVQDKAKRARQHIHGRGDAMRASPTTSVLSDRSDELHSLHQIREEELDAAVPIAQRLDELLQSPPYDTTPILLELRGMVALWLSDLHKQLAQDLEDSNENLGEDEGRALVGEDQSIVSTARHRQFMGQERQRAKDVFTKMVEGRMDLGPQYVAFLADGNN